MVRDGLAAAIQKAIWRGCVQFGSQERLAQECGLHRNTISRWARGDLREPELAKVVRLFEITGSDLNELKADFDATAEQARDNQLLLEIRAAVLAVLEEQRRISGAQLVVLGRPESSAFDMPALGQLVGGFEERAKSIKQEQSARRAGKLKDPANDPD